MIELIATQVIISRKSHFSITAIRSPNSSYIKK